MPCLVQQPMRRCLRCLVSIVASLWLAIVAPLLCSAHGGEHTHLLDSHLVKGAYTEMHEHVHDQTAFDVHSHQHGVNRLPDDSHCEPVGDTQWALTMTISAPDAIVLPGPHLSTSTAPGFGTALPYYPLRPDRPPLSL